MEEKKMAVEEMLKMEAISFYNLPPELKSQQIEWVMSQSLADFNPAIMTSQYIQLYEKMLERSLFT